MTNYLSKVSNNFEKVFQTQETGVAFAILLELDLILGSNDGNLVLLMSH